MSRWACSPSPMSVGCVRRSTPSTVIVDMLDWSRAPASAMPHGVRRVHALMGLLLKIRKVIGLGKLGTDLVDIWRELRQLQRF